MWPWILGGLLLGGLGLGKLGEAGDIISGLGEAGAAPGTTPEGEDLVTFTPASEGGTGAGWSSDLINSLDDNLRLPFVNMLNQWGETSPRALGYLLTLQDTAANQEYQQGRAGEVEQLYRESPANRYPAMIEDVGSRMANLGEQSQQRQQGYSTRAGELSGKVEDLGDTQSAYYRKLTGSTDVTNQAEMDAIAGRLIGDTGAFYEGRSQQLEGEAAARGLSPTAVRAMRESLASENYRANLQNVANVAEMNAANRPAMISATTGAGGAANTIYGLAANIADAANRAGISTDTLVGQLLGQEAGTYSTAASIQNLLDAGLGTAIYNEAALHQPLDWLAGSEMAYEDYLTQQLREAGYTADQAQTLVSMAMGLLNTGSGIQQSKLLEDSQDSSWFGDNSSTLGTLAGMGADVGLGMLGLPTFGGLSGLQSMLLSGAVGGNVGSLFSNR